MLIGVPHITALNRVLRKLKDYQIKHYVWTEPDNDMGTTAIATEPLDAVRKGILANYRLYAPGAATAACLIAQNGGSNTRVAQ